MSEGLLLLCAMNSGRVAQDLDTGTGLKYPVALPKPGGALDRTIARVGWTALKPGVQPSCPARSWRNQSRRSNHSLDRLRLANSRFVIANARHENEQTAKRIQLVSVDGVERQVDGPFQNAVGDLPEGTR
jgi:hypothetical protein